MAASAHKKTPVIFTLLFTRNLSCMHETTLKRTVHYKHVFTERGAFQRITKKTNIGQKMSLYLNIQYF